MWKTRIACALLLAGTPLFAQRGGRGGGAGGGGRGQDAAVREGAGLYGANCSNCHGPRGDLVSDVDLGHNKFRRATTDDELIGIITTGIPGTAMPPANMPREQAALIVAYLRSLGTPGTSGNPAKGRELFASKGCQGCHRILGVGPRTGPDLSEIGSFRRAQELQQSILDPDADIQPENRTFTATLRDGTKITGHVINEDGFTIQVLDSRERLLSIDKANLRESSYSEHSPMPSYKDKLTPQELDDLVSYLISLKRMDAK
jgi:putative heme-binding domain-containing protein